MGILLDLEKERLREAIAEQKVEIENLKAELEAAYESRKLMEEQRGRGLSTAIKPREQEMNEKKMGC